MYFKIWISVWQYGVAPKFPSGHSKYCSGKKNQIGPKMHFSYTGILKLQTGQLQLEMLFIANLSIVDIFNYGLLVINDKGKKISREEFIPSVTSYVLCPDMTDWPNRSCELRRLDEK